MGGDKLLMAQTLIDVRMIKNITATITELNYIDGVTSPIQTQFSGKVSITGDESVAGVKTFSSFPITPSAAPTSDYQVVNKKYVDDNSVSVSIVRW